jgi:hypothetical protein
VGASARLVSYRVKTGASDAHTTFAHAVKAKVA